MSSSRKALFSLGALVLCLIAAIGFVWFGSGHPVENPVDQAEAKAAHSRDTRSAERLVDLKNSSLADLENGHFAQADQALLNVETAGAGEKVGRNWAIERLMALEAIDLTRDPTAYDEAVERAQTAMNLETALEAKSPIRHYLAGKLGQARHSPKLRVFEQHIAAGTAPGDPVQWCELYQAQLSSGTPADLADSEGTLKTLQDLVPDNLYAQVEWLGVQARRKDSRIGVTLDRLRSLLGPLLAEHGREPASRVDSVLAATEAAAKAANWQTVAKKVTEIVEVVRRLPELEADRRRIERGLSWHVVSDFSHAYYQKHHIERRLPSAGKPVQLRELDLSGVLAQISDAREARFVDFDRDGRLDIVVLRSQSLEVFARDPNDKWMSIASAPVPRDAYNHFLPVDLSGNPTTGPEGGDQAKSNGGGIDFVLFGPAGLLVIGNRAEPLGSKRTLQPVLAPSLAEGTKNALSIVAADLDEDGLIDLVVSCRDPKGETTLHAWRNQGKRSFQDVTARSGLLNVSVGGGSLLAVDFDNDLDVDLVAPGVSSPSQSAADIAFFKGRGLARFRPQRFPVKDSDVRSATAIAVLDADSNGSWDLLASGPHGMFLLLTATTEHGRVETIGVEAVSDFAFEHVLVFDYDNDGCPDLVVWNGQAVRCFHGGNEGHFEPAVDLWPSALGAIASVDCGDLDQDGDSDLVIVKAGPGKSGGRVAVLQNEGGNANNWIDVRLLSRLADAKVTTRNRIPPFGLGSTLCLKTKAVSQMQIVEKPVTHFGIGTLEAADVLRILWNTGVPVNVLAPTKNTTVTQTPPTQSTP
jgi:hypothetical protein